MTLEHARQILMLHRPGVDDASDPELEEALNLLRENPDLRAWFEEHRAFQQAMRRKLQEIEAPQDLKARIEAAQKILRPRFPWRGAARVAAAAAVILLGLTLAGVFTPPVPDGFADYRSRMVRMALREYRMDILTNDLDQVRRFLATNGAPANFSLPAGLGRLSLTGGGLVRWRGHPVSMVCFDRGDREMLFLFVLDRAAVPDAPPPVPEVAKVNKLLTASWSQDNRTYVLAGPQEAEFLKKYY